MDLTQFSRDDGRNDDRKGRRLGNHSQRCLNAASQTHILEPTTAGDPRLRPGSRWRFAVRISAPRRLMRTDAVNVRVLRSTGLFLYFTFGQPHFRKRYLSKPDTQLEIRQLGEAFHYYFYILRRQ